MDRSANRFPDRSPERSADAGRSESGGGLPSSILFEFNVPAGNVHGFTRNDGVTPSTINSGGLYVNGERQKKDITGLTSFQEGDNIQFRWVLSAGNTNLRLGLGPVFAEPLGDVGTGVWSGSMVVPAGWDGFIAVRRGTLNRFVGTLEIRKV